jgi:two-component system, NtrC family, sensor histidine kinase HydH
MRRFYPALRMVPLVGMLATVFLLVFAFVLGFVSFGKMRQVVTEEFNRQQLVLAENLAALIQQDLDFLRRELTVLNLSPSVQYSEAPSLGSRLKVTLASIQEGELLEIRRVSATGQEAVVLDRSGVARTELGRFADDPYFAWALSPGNRGRILLGEPPVQVKNLYKDRSPVIMAIPHYQTSPDEAHPHPTGQFSGVLIFVLDASAIARRFAEHARSGATGYAWVIDEQGTFLAHPMASFVGKNAFKARPERNPTLGFEGINAIMRDRMLKGKEGTGSYVSGWHRQEVGPVHKLIGFCPVRIDPGNPDRLWSVAVAAPVSEVHGLVGSLFMRQFFMQAAIVLAILAGGLSVFRLERYWSQIQKQREREVNLSSRLASLGTLAAGVAHEINNPIAIILGFTDILLEKTPPGTEGHDQLKIIERQGFACKKIVENLGCFARIPEQRTETTDLNAEIRRSVAMVQNTLLTEKIQCVTDLQDGLPQVMGDPQGIQQVLLNLITNARGAMKERGGILSVQTHRVDDHAVLAVSDTGHGIRKKDLGRIFDPFFTTKAPGDGTGLGLSISHGIIEKAGGTIAVVSRHEDDAGTEQSGTIFSIRLPIVSQDS